jgi:hypothetical protein
MNGLRIYINPSIADVAENELIFYSRRLQGPYYRWSYERKVEQWRVARLDSAEFPVKGLSTANWKTIPSLLKLRLKLHYDE